MKRSATLALNEAIAHRRALGEDVLNLGFGEAGLPVHPELSAALSAAATGCNNYGSVVGSEPARRAAAGYFERGGLPTTPAQVVLGPGSKALLLALLQVLDGDVVLPVPSWVTYAAQAQLVGKQVVRVPVPPAAGGLPDPRLLDAALEQARREGLNPGTLVLTLPDNPTGTVPDAELVSAVCRIAERHGLTIVADEIYRELAFDPAGHVSPAALAPANTVVTTGLSKTMALGGWRIGVLRVPTGDRGAALLDKLAGVGSEMWSCLAGPMQQVAEIAFTGSPGLDEFVAMGRRLHRTVTEAAHRLVVAAGAECRPPQAGFYLYPDFEPFRAALADRGIDTGEQLADHLLTRHGLGVIAGEHFGDDPRSLRFRLSTSLIYGEAAQRWEALRSDRPTELPRIAQALRRVETALADVTGAGPVGAGRP